MKLVLATGNPDKAREIEAVLRAHLPGLELVPRPGDVDEVEETGATLTENARLKAQALAGATGLPAVADDTGLEVDALDGAPGVYSSRFAGAGASYDANLSKLLSDMDGVPDGDRTARFTTVAMAVWPDGRELAATGVVEGVIVRDRRGTGGFGYDPVFVPREGDGRTFAEMTPDEKHALSHRGRAFRALAHGLADASFGA